MTRSLHICCIGLAVLLAGAAGPAGANMIQDTFDDDTIGQPPNGPEHGWATYGGPAVTHQVVSGGGGDLLLYSTDPVGNDGISIVYNSLDDQVEATASWQFMVEGGAYLFGQNAMFQILNFEGELASWPYIKLMWGDDGRLRLQTGDPYDMYDTGFTWSTATYYDVVVDFSCVTDTFSLTVNGTPIVTDRVFCTLATELYRLVISSNYSTTCTQRLDDVLVTPEPATLSLLAIGGMAMLRRRRRQ